MALRPFSRVVSAPTSNPITQLNLTNDRVDSFATSIASTPIINAILVSASLVEGKQSVAHGLGKVPQWAGFRVLGDQADIGEYASADSKYLYVRASAPCSATVLVF
jgi:hypothetical protein